MASDPQILSGSQALLKYLGQQLTTARHHEIVGAASIERLLRPPSATTGPLRTSMPQRLSLSDRDWTLNRIVSEDRALFLDDRRQERDGIPGPILRLIRHRGPQLVISIQAILRDLQSGSACTFLEKRLPVDLLTRAGKAMECCGPARQELRRCLASPDNKKHPMAASLLHLSGEPWRPGNGCSLRGGFFESAKWREIHLGPADLAGAVLRGADLSQAVLDSVVLDGADLRDAVLFSSSMTKFHAVNARMDRVNMGEVTAKAGNFTHAVLREARLQKARLHSACFSQADLSGADFTDAEIPSGRFKGALLHGARFCDADLRHACLDGLDLRQCDFTRARLSRASLDHANLEYLELPGADFELARLSHSHLTGSFMPGANFRKAQLHQAGLGEIQWERADLRGADLRQASFHMGSSRDGLVFSPLASEGTRTGFYTDDYEDLSFKSPEEIRKANLCGADLRGALIDGTDFYLVDLRGAQYGPDQEKHFRKCGAILGVSFLA